MNKNIIQNHWMEIGTGNKEINYTSSGGRIKTGAKGIGRFALDRLGLSTEMWTVTKDKKSSKGHHWGMDWKQFEAPNKSVSEIEAELEEKEVDIKIFLHNNDKSI